MSYQVWNRHGTHVDPSLNRDLLFVTSNDTVEWQKALVYFHSFFIYIHRLLFTKWLTAQYVYWTQNCQPIRYCATVYSRSSYLLSALFRVQPGVCYHLFPQYVHNNTMNEFLSPEISRMRLEDVILRIKASAVDWLVLFSIFHICSLILYIYFTKLFVLLSFLSHPLESNQLKSRMRSTLSQSGTGIHTLI